MRRMVWDLGEEVGTMTADLADDGTWTCGDKLICDSLNAMSKQVLAESSPSDGEPVANIFAAAVRRWEPDSVIDDTTVGQSPTGTTP